MPPTPASAQRPEAISLASRLAAFSDHFNPRIIAELNGQELRLVKFDSPFVWHAHPDADEAFLVLAGTMRLGIRDRAGDPTSERFELVRPGELIVLPAGVEHRPDSAALPGEPREVHMLCFEKAGCLNTGDAPQSDLTRQTLRHI